jgi:hypothetical protein
MLLDRPSVHAQDFGAMAGASVFTCRDSVQSMPFRVTRESGDSLFVLSWEHPRWTESELFVDILEPDGAERLRLVGYYHGLSSPMWHAGFVSRSTRLNVHPRRFSLSGSRCRYLPFSISTKTDANNVWDTVVRLIPDPRQLYLRYDSPSDLAIQMADPMPGGYPSTPLHLDHWYLNRLDGRIRKGAWWVQNRSVRWIVDRSVLVELDPSLWYEADGQKRQGWAWIEEKRLSRKTAKSLGFKR